MPAIIIGGVELGGLWRGDLDRRRRWLPLAAAAGVFVLVVAPWAVARWQVDGWRFFDAMFFHDFVDRASTVLEGHEGAPYYYFYFLQKHHYDWLLAALVALTCLPERWTRVRTLMTGPDRFTGRAAARRGSPATFVLPSVVATKLGWYLNSFYPLFALVRRARGRSRRGGATAPHPRRAAAGGGVLRRGPGRGRRQAGLALVPAARRRGDRRRACSWRTGRRSRASTSTPPSGRTPIASWCGGRRALPHRGKRRGVSRRRAMPTTCGWGRPPSTRGSCRWRRRAARRLYRRAD